VAESPLVQQLLAQRDVLLAYILALTGDRVAAEDVFQETALAVLEEARKGVQARNFQAWSREIARRRVAEYYRKKSCRPRCAQDFDRFAQAVEQSFEERLISAEASLQRQQLLAECLERLTDKARHMVIERYAARRSPTEIAKLVGWGVGSVKVALCRARRVLFECVNSGLKAAENA
jgi:RNA polymerase sigma-70 factor (ECF subfamily)